MVKRLLFLGAIGLGLLTQTPLFSAARWEFAGWFGGSCYPNVEFDPRLENRIYMASESAGIWRSDDLGENWRFMTEGLGNFNVAFVAVAPSDSRRLFAGTNGGLYRSNDAGEHWEPCDQMGGSISFERPFNYDSVAIKPANASWLAVGTEKGAVFYSEDAGDHWRALGSRTNPFEDNRPISVLKYSHDESYLYAASEKGLSRYSFALDEWKFLEKSPPGITDLFVSKKFPGKLYAAGQRTLAISEDGGDSWKASAPAPRDGKIYRMIVDESGKRARIVAGSNKGWYGGIILSDNEGVTWSTSEERLFSDPISNPTRAWQKSRGKIASIKMSPHNPSVLFRTDWWGAWRSDDGGLIWHEKIKGAPTVIGSDIYITRKGELFVATMDDGLLKSSDFGKRYRAVIPGEKNDKSVSGHVWRVAELAGPSGNLIATSSPWAEKINQVFICDNSGNSCVATREGLPSARPLKNTIWKEGYPRALAADPRDPKLVYLGMDGDDGGGLFVSRNGGWNWERSVGQPGSLRVYNALFVDPTDPNRIFWGAVGEEGGVYVSNDRGGTWKHALKSVKSVYDLAVSKEGVVFAAGKDKGPCLYVSFNHGHDWTLLKRFEGEGTCEAIAIHPENSKIIAVSTLLWNWDSGAKIYLSEDGGTSWNDIQFDLPDGLGAAAMVFNPKDSSLYVCRYSGSVYKLDIDKID